MAYFVREMKFPFELREGRNSISNLSRYSGLISKNLLLNYSIYNL